MATVLEEPQTTDPLLNSTSLPKAQRLTRLGWEQAAAWWAASPLAVKIITVCLIAHVLGAVAELAKTGDGLRRWVGSAEH